MSRSRQVNQAALKRKERAEKARKKYRFIGLRMWWSILLSKIFSDRDFINTEAGNNIYVGNNVIITKNSKIALLLVTDLGDRAPKFFTSYLINEVKKKFKDVSVDFKYKNSSYHPSTKTDLKNREELWTNILLKDKFTADSKSRAQRCLFTADLLKDKIQLYKTRFYVILKVGKEDSVNDVVKVAKEFLQHMGISSRRVSSQIMTHLQYISLLSNKEPKHMKDIPYIITSDQVLAEMMPNAQGMNDDDGTMIATDIVNDQPYIVNFRRLSGAKNIGVFAPSGEGKTFLCQIMGQNFYLDDYRECIDDIKGNEFTEHTRACGGTVLNFGPRSTTYINHFIWDDRVKGNIQEYASGQFTLCKQEMMILAQVREDQEVKLDLLIENFLKDLYMMIGANMNNKNTWKRTRDLTPQRVYRKFEDYLSEDIINSYGDVARTAYNNLGKYWDTQGSMAHTFRDALAYERVLDTPVLTFAYDVLDDTSNIDEALFKVRVLDARVIKDAYFINNKKLGLWTVFYMEEAAIAADFIMQEYNRSFILRRAQNVINIIIGNSLQAITDNPYAKGIISNLNMFIVGCVDTDSREYLLKQYSLKQKNKEYLEAIQDKEEYERTFVVINRLQKKPIDTLLKVFVPKSLLSSKVFKGVDVIDA